MSDSSVTFKTLGDVLVAKVQDQKITRETGKRLYARTAAGDGLDSSLKVVLDLSNLTFLGSIGLTVLVVLLKRVTTAGGQLAIVGLTGQSRGVMTVTRLEKVFKYYASVDQALDAVAGA